MQRDDQRVVGSAPSAEATDDERDPTRLTVLEVTYRLLEEKGYASVTTDDIAASARVSKATIYRLWRTKQELVVDATRMHFGKVGAPDLGSFRAEVHWILEHRMRDYRDPKTLRLVAGLVGAAVFDPQLEDLFREWVEQLSGTIHEVVERGIARGDVRSDVDTFALENLITGVVSRAVIAQVGFSSETVESMVELIARTASSEEVT